MPYRFRPRRVPANAPRRRGIPGALDLAALCALAGSKRPKPEAALQGQTGRTIPEVAP
jgi:hypothetical protein